MSANAKPEAQGGRYVWKGLLEVMSLEVSGQLQDWAQSLKQTLFYGCIRINRLNLGCHLLLFLSIFVGGSYCYVNYVVQVRTSHVLLPWKSTQLGALVRTCSCVRQHPVVHIYTAVCMYTVAAPSFRIWWPRLRQTVFRGMDLQYITLLPTNLGQSGSQGAVDFKHLA